MCADSKTFLHSTIQQFLRKYANFCAKFFLQSKEICRVISQQKLVSVVFEWLAEDR